ncbi:MAG TPA: hypothetical protein VF153_08205 [Candidatus Limnocylindria bacterium]
MELADLELLRAAIPIEDGRQDDVAAAWRVVDEEVASYLIETCVRRAPDRPPASPS